jgi:hypothetical protein
MDDFFDFMKVASTAILLIFGLIALIVLATAYGLVRPSCYAQWADSGMQVRWSFFGDCQLKQPDETWITDEAYIALNKNIRLNQP